MVTKKMTINIPTGLEARPVAILVQVASQYDSSIYIECEEKKVNAKSIMGMMSLGLPAGEEIIVSANGKDEEAAIQNIEKYLSSESQQ
ncbi:HPr family phosphocarrier protein [Velocimicrobium porci]|uniref:HPr family phosphocarrier protein n=1 Tax=Velocimicrobium porci TaxID=2606634 RepID=A0A6L5XV98_9FIRM|nr:HPr family phosphocarrier protein [Velocimicrobium porci]MSS62760.1 HPr family phosphocarrier protein [Velocimicrobium porci]